VVPVTAAHVGSNFYPAVTQQPQTYYPGPTATSLRPSNSGSNLNNLSQQPVTYASSQPVPQASPSGSFYGTPNSSNTLNNTSMKTNIPTITRPSGSQKTEDEDDEAVQSPIPLPEIPQSFPELDKLTDTQLERLLHDDVAIEVPLP
jgi:hypothetical protein